MKPVLARQRFLVPKHRAQFVLFAAPLTLAALLLASPASAQLAPGIGYMFPPGGQAGTTIDVRLGGYDWTPDVQLFVHDERIKLEMLGPPGPIIVPEPPYWFGKKGRGTAFPLPRETSARLTIPADISPGVIRWQVANANGASDSGCFVVGAGLQVVEQRHKQDAQVLPSLPITVAGQVAKIEEVDRYELTAPRAGPITCRLVAREIDSPLNAVLEVRDVAGQLVADVADSEGRDAQLTFAALAGAKYTVSVHDLDFRGNRSYVYRLTLTPGPAVLAAIPAAGKRGTSRDVELVGIGVATGAPRMESVTRRVEFPADGALQSWAYTLQTDFGAAEPFRLALSDLDEQVEPNHGPAEACALSVPGAITGVLDAGEHEDRYTLTGKKDDTLDLLAQAQVLGSPLDVSLAVFDAEGKEIARGDDAPGTTDASLHIVLPADGQYQVQVTDLSGNAGNRAAVYRLVARPTMPDFSLTMPQQAALPVGGSVAIPVTVQRAGGLKEELKLTITGLPAGITAAEATIPAGKPSAKLELAAAENAAAVAAVIHLTATAQVGEQTISRQSGPLLLATVMKPRALVKPEGLDDVRKVPRGATYAAPVLLTRMEGYSGPITLEMTARQQRHRQGIHGPEIVVPAEADRATYPIFLPEWLETTRTSRIILNTVVQVPDPQGNMHYLVNKMEKRIGFLPEGALLALSHEARELRAGPGEAIEVPLMLARAARFTEPAKIELVLDEELTGRLTAEPLTLSEGTQRATLKIVPIGTGPPPGEQTLTIRATALEGGTLPAVSETTVVVEFLAP